MPKLLLGLLSALLLSGLMPPAFATTLELISRPTPIPRTTDSVPHVQIGVQAVPELSEKLLARVKALPGVVLGPTRLSLPGAVGFQLQEDLPLAHPEAIVGGREFAHLHPDGSLHASLDPAVAIKAIRAGWAVAHPWANRREGWAGFVMIYTPTTQEELAVVERLIESSHAYITGLAR
ncbi:luciferase family protein [Roseibium sediminis]|uniref:luciferase domain-containing protein n=1 Tax=Roseibium sediminis TaxID=1775174 RepID=UPI00123D1D6D|nr:luciferase family protein [Roseibium sediminis]